LRRSLATSALQRLLLPGNCEETDPKGGHPRLPDAGGKARAGGNRRVLSGTFPSAAEGAPRKKEANFVSVPERQILPAGRAGLFAGPG